MTQKKTDQKVHEDCIESKGKQNCAPQSLSDFIGQGQIIKDLSVQVSSAQKRGVSLNHIALFGPPGLGKTTLSRIIANEMESNYSEITGHSITTQKVADILLSLEMGDILFVDEVHAMRTRIAEMFYSPMQDFMYEGNRLPPFTLIGATTNLGKLPKPMRDRIVHQYVFEYYSKEDITKILEMRGACSKVAQYIAQRSKGVPRHAVHYMIKVRGYLDKDPEALHITVKHCKEAFDALKIDELGLGPLDRKLLAYMRQHGAVTTSTALGLDALVQVMDTTKEIYANMIEPYLITEGMIERTPRGRILTPSGLKYAKESGRYS